MQLAFVYGAINLFKTSPVLESLLHVKRAPIGIRGAMGARPKLCPAANLRGIKR